MSAKSSTLWFWSDWLGDQAVRRLTPAERGVWIDLLALMAAASPAGYLCDDRGTPLTDSEIARVTNAASAEEVGKLIAEILRKGVASRDRCGRLFNRRMVRDAELKRKRSEAGRSGGDSTALKYFGKKFLPQQVPKQTRTRQSNPLRKTTFFPEAAREVTPQVAIDEEVERIKAKPPTDRTLREINILQYGRRSA
jgi:hypothetical protein